MQKWLDGCAISAGELRTTLNLKSMWECVQNIRPQWFGHL